MKKSTTLLLLLLFSFSLSASNYYWVNGNGDWSDVANHWATTSGGAVFYAQSPTASDDVFFDANSFTATGQAVNIDVLNANCHNMDWTGVTNAPQLSSASAGNFLYIYGSLQFSPAMTNNFTGFLYFAGTSAGQTVGSAGLLFSCKMAFDGIGGSWTLNDSLYNLKEIWVNAGTLNTANHNIRCKDFSSGGGPDSLLFGTSVITTIGTSTSNGNFYLSGSNFFLDADSALIIVRGGIFHIGYSGMNFPVKEVQLTDTGCAGCALESEGYDIGVVRSTRNITELTCGYPLHIDSLFCSGTIEFRSGGLDLNWGHVAKQAVFCNQAADLPAHFGTLLVDSSVFNCAGDNEWNNNTFDRLAIGGHLDIQQTAQSQQLFHYCSVGDDITLTASSTFDTLIVSPGAQFKLPATDTTYINNDWQCTGTGAQPISIVSDNPGTAATLHLVQPFCGNFLDIIDSRITGTVLVYAGANSADLGNNSGWQFVSCTLGMEEQDGANISLYPQPAAGDVQVETMDIFHGDIFLELRDVTGQLIRSEKLSGNKIIRRADCAAGLYLFQLRDACGTTAAGKIIFE